MGEAYLICAKCGHIGKVDSSIENKLRIAAKAFYEIEFSELFRLNKQNLRCKNCNARGQVELFQRSIELTEKRPSSQRKSVNPFRVPQNKLVIQKQRRADITSKRQVASYSSKKRKSKNISKSDNLCIDCGEPIPKARLKAKPNASRCVGCQSSVESADPNSYVRRVDEGLAGTREGHKRMRGQVWGDMLRRSRE